MTYFSPRVVSTLEEFKALRSQIKNSTSRKRANIFFKKKGVSGFHRARKLFYRNLRTIFFVVSSRSALNNLFIESCMDEHYSLEDHKNDLGSVIRIVRKIARCCLFLDRKNECEELCNLNFEIFRFHKTLFGFDTIFSSNTYGTYDLFQTLTMVRKSYEIHSSRDLRSKYISLPNLSDISRASQVTEGSLFELKLNRDPMLYEKICEKMGYKKRDRYSPQPFRDFLKKFSGSVDELAEERVEFFLHEHCHYRIIFGDRSTIHASKILLVDAKTSLITTEYYI